MLREHRLLLVGSVALGVAAATACLWPQEDEASENASLQARSAAAAASVSPALMPADPSVDELEVRSPPSPVTVTPKAELLRAQATRVVLNDAPVRQPTVTERLLERDRAALGVFEKTVAQTTPNSPDSPSARLVELQRDRLKQRIAQRERTLQHERNQQAQ